MTRPRAVSAEPVCPGLMQFANTLQTCRTSRRQATYKGPRKQEVKAMRPKQFVVKPGDRSAALSVVGTNVTVLVSAADSKGQQVTLQSGDAGSGPPPHSHDWDESFYVTRGQVEFTCAGETTMCVSGTFVYVPAGVVHAFSYGPAGGE